jgi:hypothetical protein
VLSVRWTLPNESNGKASYPARLTVPGFRRLSPQGQPSLTLFGEAGQPDRSDSLRLLTLALTPEVALSMRRMLAAAIAVAPLIAVRRLATAAAVIVCAGLFHIQWTAAARGSTVLINCLPGGGGLSSAPFQAKGAPRNCDIQGQPENLGTLIPLRDAHWSSWGGSLAEAVGRQLNKHPGQGGPSSYPVHIRLYRIRPGCHGHLYYTRAAYGITSYGPDILRISPSCKSIPQPL